MPPPKHIHPSIELKAFSCPHCSALADQHWYNLYARSLHDGQPPSLMAPNAPEALERKLRETHSAQEKAELESLIEWIAVVSTGAVHIEPMANGEWASHNVYNLWISRCFSCKRFAVWRYETLIYPVLRYEIEPNADLPDEIRADFDEARAVFDTSPRAAAALLRLCIQKLCIHLGEKGKNINDDIGSLVEKGLPTTVQKALDLVRVVGNNAVHPGTLDLNDDRVTAAKLFVLVNMVAEKLITEPKAVAALFDEKVPPGAKSAIAKRDGTKPS